MPRFVRSKYQQYKQDTQQLSTWLALTAINYGFPLTSFASAPPPADSAQQADEPAKTAQQRKNAKKNLKKKTKAKHLGDEGNVNGERAGNGAGVEGPIDDQSGGGPDGSAQAESVRPGEWIASRLCA